MKQVLFLFIAAAIVLTGVWGVITVYDNNMRAGRMWETPAIRPHEKPLPIMAAGIVPLRGGEAFARDPDADLRSPINHSLVIDFKEGRKAYNRYCSHCHGRHYDGMGTVGQSFAPLPSDLRSQRVQSMTDADLYREISFGKPGGRQPPLATTISRQDRWQVIAYLKSLGARP